MIFGWEPKDFIPNFRGCFSHTHPLPGRYRLHFERESREEVERRKKIAREKILQPVSEAEMEVDIEDVYKTGSGEESRSGQGRHSGKVLVNRQSSWLCLSSSHFFDLLEATVLYPVGVEASCMLKISLA